MTGINDITDLLYEGGTPMQGRKLSEDEAIALVEEKAPHKPWCIVKNWTWIDLEISPSDRTAVAQAGYSPVMIYAHHVIQDSRGRFRTGDWVRSTPLIAFSENCLFETRNTVYVLTGTGTRKTAELATVMKIF